MKIPLAQFRQFSPAGIFPDHAANDALEVVIPIDFILERLKPGQLPRRSDQRKVEVPDDIESVFGPHAGKNGNLRIVHEKNKPAVAKPLTAPSAASPAPQAAPFTEAAPGHAPVATVAAVPTVAAVAPVELAAAPAPVSAPAPLPPPEPVLNVEPIRAPRLDPGLATLRAPAAPREKTLTVALMDVAAFWAEKGRRELENLYRHSVEFPLSAIEAGLKKGRVEFTWREMRPWFRVATGNSLPELPDETRIEFPLAFLAPRFLEGHGGPSTRKKIEVSDEIPDVFVKNVPAAPPEAAAPPAPPEANGAVEEGTPGELGDIFGQPEKKSWSLTEISHGTSKLPGVAGAIIATTDGLLVGGSWPEGVGGEAVAAFVPQIYNRLTNYTSELKLGTPGDFTLLVENVPLQIFKSANSYLTVLGRAGEHLPTRKLKAIATRLAANPTHS
jgi:predicted regulator of Ras-like GTPase activity (Roadblock/LC7/MglB family)